MADQPALPLTPPTPLCQFPAKPDGSERAALHLEAMLAGIGEASELDRLKAAVNYCRMRLKRDAYRETLAAILRGDKDESIRYPDFTQLILSECEPTEVSDG
jgi:hypothetical protein